LDLLGAKRISDSEELVLNVVAAITNLLFYDVPTNLLFEEDNKLLLCRLFRPLLLDSYNIEALIETARALGNLGRHSDARQHMTNLRLDEILVILLDHENRELVYYVSGAIVNLAADAECTSRLAATCPEKLAKLLHDAPADDYALQLVAVKVLTNLSIDPGALWSLPETEVALLQLVSSEGTDSTGKECCDSEDRRHVMELAQHLLEQIRLSGGGGALSAYGNSKLEPQSGRRFGARRPKSRGGNACED